MDWCGGGGGGGGVGDVTSDCDDVHIGGAFNSVQRAEGQPLWSCQP
jgi:hypothetical protein